MKFEQSQYNQVKADARYVADIAKELTTVKSLENAEVLETSKLRTDYEERKLRDIKNAITNIYLVLELNKVKGIADEIYNSEFKAD